MDKITITLSLSEGLSDKELQKLKENIEESMFSSYPGFVTAVAVEQVKDGERKIIGKSNISF